MRRARALVAGAAVLAAALLPGTALPGAALAAAPAPAGGVLLVVVGDDAPGGQSPSVRGTGARLVGRVPGLHAALVRVPAGEVAAASARLAARPGVRYVEPLATRTTLDTGGPRPRLTAPARPVPATGTSDGGGQSAPGDAPTATPAPSSSPPPQGVSSAAGAADPADETRTPERAELGLDRLARTLPGADGHGVVVAVLDTGVDPDNPDLAGRVTDGGDYSGEARRSGGTVDGNGHGTGVAALAAAALDGRGMVGAAPAATVRSYKVLDASGSGGSLGLALAIRQVADDAAAGLPIAVANMSLGGPFRSRVETEALAYAARVAPGVLFVAASGNDGGSRPSYPAAFPGVFSVGASGRGADGTWRRASFSTTADVDVLAPGVDVTTYDYVPGAGAPVLGPVSGTSEAAPAVAGVVAALASGRDVRGQQAATLLKASAAPALPVAGDGAGDGAGRADAAAAAALGDGAHAYSTVFADGGAHLAADATRTLVVDRFVPAGAPAGPATLSTSQGELTPGTENTVGATGGTLSTRRYAFRLPTQRSGAWTTGGPGDDAGVPVPFAGLPLVAGEHGQPVRSGESVRATLGGGDGTAALVSFTVLQGEVFTISGSAPEGGGPLYLWAPETTGGTASSYDEPAEEVPLVAGAASYRAPRSGRYVVGHLLTSDSTPRGAYTIRADAPEPVATARVDAVTSTGTEGLPFRVRWSGAPRFDVQWAARVRSGGAWVTTPWRTWLADTAATTSVFGVRGPTAVRPGTTYLLRVVGRDGLGGTGDPSAAVVAAVPYDDRDGLLRYTAGWRGLDGAPGRFGGTLHSSAVPGAAVTVTGEAAELALVADRGPGLGQVDVLVDGVRRARVDLGAGRAATRQVVWRSGALPGGVREHRLRLQVVGTRGRPTVAVDAVVVRR